MKKKIIVGLIIFIGLIAAWVINLLWSAGSFKTIEPHFVGKCSQVGGLAGAEDITIHPKTGIAYISVFDRRAVVMGKTVSTGIYGYDLNERAPQLIRLIDKTSQTFLPHGISLYIGEEGHDVLFVINHAKGEHNVDIFDLVDGKFSHRTTISNVLITSPNDLVAVGPDSFYVSNDHKYLQGMMRTIEDYMRLELSNVVYCKGADCNIAATGFGYANGLNVSPDKKTIYLATTVEKTLFIFNRDLKSGRLKLEEKIVFDTGLDNIEIDQQANLWIGAHPQLLKFVAHAGDKSKISPSQILRLTPKPQGGFLLDEVYLNRGEELSGSSVGAVRDGRLLIGSVFEPKILDCKLK